jgi:conserved oligomeric Golgi complex subunit 3
MTLVKIFFVNFLRILTTDIQSRLAEGVRHNKCSLPGSDSGWQDVSSTALTHLFYSKFASVAAQISPLLSEMERRASSYPDELLSLLAECHTAYLTARRTLLGPQITNEVKGMDPAHSELVELVC